MKGLSGVCFLVAFGWASLGHGAERPVAGGGDVQFVDLPGFSLTVPASAGERDYLGLSGEGSFNLSQVSAKVVLVEVFSFYCPHCQRAAPQVNALYRRIEERSDTRGVIKLIGIGAGNSAYEVRQFQEKYSIPFPLFSDGDLEITRMLEVRATPTFVGVGVMRDGGPKKVLFHEGSFADEEKLLTEILSRYQLAVEKRP